VLDQPVGALEAAGEEVLEVGTGLLDLGGRVGRRVDREERVELLVAHAVDRVRKAGAARVEAHDVVALVERRAEGHAGGRGVRRAGGAGATGVDHQ
jgi:hypothetical protein